MIEKMMRIGYLGAGSWGFCLSHLLAKKGHKVTLWSPNEPLVKKLNQGGDHPKLPGFYKTKNLHLTTNLPEALEGQNFLVESLTSSGIRPVFEKIKETTPLSVPMVFTSKGIESSSGKILSEIVLELLGEEVRPYLGCLSGPGYAKEVIQNFPTSVVASGYHPETIQQICHVFTTPFFRVYPNADMKGVALGGALKNIIAIASGIAEGLHLGWSAKAAIICRGLHEMRKLAVSEGCFAETLNGLSGMGDLCLTCSSPISRNFQFGELLAKGVDPQVAEQSIGMVVEGKYTSKAALKLSQKNGIIMPITEAVYQIIYEKLSIQQAISGLMNRAIKEEHL